jgi:hypothetical protein
VARKVVRKIKEDIGLMLRGMHVGEPLEMQQDKL